MTSLEKELAAALVARFPQDARWDWLDVAKFVLANNEDGMQ